MDFKPFSLEAGATIVRICNVLQTHCKKSLQFELK